MQDFAQQRRQRLIGIALMCCAVGLFACLDTIGQIPQHPDGHHAGGLGALYVRLPAHADRLNPVTQPGLLRTGPAQAAAHALAAAGRRSTVLNFLALRWMQLDEVLSIIFTFPFIVAIASIPLLGERIGWRRWSGDSASALPACC